MFSMRKAHLLGTKGKHQRWYCNVGLGFKTPEAAIKGNYIDKKCPFTSNVSIRGAILRGLVISTKMQRTIIVRRDYLQYIKKYRRYLCRLFLSLIVLDTRRDTAILLFTALLLSMLRKVTLLPSVSAGILWMCNRLYFECRPLAKTVRFNVLAHVPQQSKGLSNIRKQFRMF